MSKKLYSFFILLTAFLWLGSGTIWGEQLNESFEGTTFAPDGWTTNHSGETTYAWARNSGGSGGYSTYCASVRYGSSGKTTVNYLITPQLRPQAGEKLVFYTKQQYNGNTTFTVEVSTTTAETSAFTTTLFTYTDAGGTTSTWAKQEIDLASYVDQDIYIAFHVVDVYGFTVYLDDVSGVTLKPESCPKPTLTRTGVSSETVSYSWAQGGSETQWQYLCLPAATTLTDEHWESATLTSSTSVTVEGLASASTYKFYLRAYCSAEDQSVEVYDEFPTDCGSIKVLPFNCDFTGTNNASPRCWTIIRTTDESYNAYIYSNQLRFEGNNSSSKLGRRVVVILPEFQADIRTLKISFDYYNKGVSTTYPEFQVGCTNSLTDATQFKVLHHITKNTSSSTGLLSMCDADEGSYLAISFTNVDGSSSSAGYSYIDNVHVESAQDCSKPATPVASNITGDGARLSWTAKAGVTSYKYCYVVSGNPADFSGNLSTSNTYVDLTGLTAGTTYDFYVMCACGDTPSDPCTFTPTSCPSVTEVTLSNGTYNSILVNWTLSGSSACDVEFKAGSGAWTSAGTNISTTSKEISGLDVGTTYSFQVKPSCSADAWVEAGDTYTPAYSKPASASVTGATDATASASWDAVADATGYEYLYIESGDPNWASATPTTETTASLTGLTGATSYTFYVRATYPNDGFGAATTANFTTSTIAPAIDASYTATTSTATFTWTANGSAAGLYQWKTSKDGSTWSAATSALTATEEGLNAGTNYTFYVRSYYGDGKYSSEASLAFVTACGTATLPFSYDFGNNGTLSPCWKNNDYSGSYYWTLTDNYTWSSTEGYNYYIGFQSRGSSASAYGVLETPSIELSNEAILTFRWRNTGVGNVQLLISTDGGSTKNSIDADINTELSTTTSWTNKSVDLSVYNGETVILYFKGFGNGSSKYIYLDDVAINVKPCAVPTFEAENVVGNPSGATVSCAEDTWSLRYKKTADADIPANWAVIENITDATKAIAGESGTEYEVQVKAVCSATRSSDWTASQTFTPQCNAPTGLSASAVSHNSATISWVGSAKALRYKTGSDDWSNKTIDPAAETFNLSGLTAETTYTVQVKAECEEGDIWSTDLEFTTKCTPITVTKVAPYEADFTGLDEVMPACWDKSETTKPYVKGEELLFDGKDQTAILPKFSNPTSGLVLKFNYKHSYAASYSGQIQVGYIDANGDFHAFGSALAGATAYTAAEINFDGVDDAEAKYIAIRLIHNNPSNISYANGFVKDVVVELAPTCYAPASIADATDITAAGANISWTASGKGESLYQWAVAEGSAAPAWVDDDDHKVGTTSKELTGLNANTDYTFYVRSYCDGDDQSEAVSKAFTTKCAAIPVANMPFEESFDAALGACWKTYAASYYNVYVSDNKLQATAPKTTGNESVVVLPAFEMALNQLVVSFDYSGSNGTIEVGYVTNAEDKTTFVPVGSAYTAASADKHAGTAFTSVGAATGNVALRFKGNTGDGEFVIDNLRAAYGIDLADNDDNSETLSGLNGQTLDVVLGRTIFCDGDYNTLCLPFSLPTLDGTSLAGGKLWAFKYGYVENGELLMRIAPATSIEAGVPYLITFASGDNIVNPTFTNVTITKSAGISVGQTADVKFVGILEPEAFEEDDHFKLFVSTGGNLAWSGVATGAANSKLRSFRGYFQTTEYVGTVPVSSGMPARIIKEEQETTGIDNTGVDAQALKLLENNQVVIIRNGVKYNIQGQVISK